MKIFLKFFVSRELLIGIVGSIIATVLVAFVGEAVPSDWKSFFTWEYISKLFSTPIPLYWILLLILILSFCFYIRKIIRYPDFLSVTSMTMGNFNWHWIWEYDPKDKDWVMTDFLPICPECGKELRQGFAEPFHKCINNHQFNIDNYLKIKAQIRTDLRKKFPKEANKIAKSLY